MKHLFAPCAAAIALFIVLPATASAAGITYDCDTAADHFSELDLPAPGGPFVVTGSVQLNALAGSTKYVPIARIQVAAAAPSGQLPSGYAGFSLSALPADPSKTPSGAPAVQMLSYNVTGKDDEVLPLTMMTKPGTIQPFKLSYDGNNVTVDLGNEAKTLSMKTAQPFLRLICSTGEFLFTNLVIESRK